MIIIVQTGFRPERYTDQVTTLTSHIEESSQKKLRCHLLLMTYPHQETALGPLIIFATNIHFEFGIGIHGTLKY